MWNIYRVMGLLNHNVILCRLRHVLCFLPFFRFLLTFLSRIIYLFLIYFHYLSWTFNVKQDTRFQDILSSIVIVVFIDVNAVCTWYCVCWCNHSWPPPPLTFLSIAHALVLKPTLPGWVGVYVKIVLFPSSGSKDLSHRSLQLYQRVSYYS